MISLYLQCFRVFGLFDAGGLVRCAVPFFVNQLLTMGQDRSNAKGSVKALLRFTRLNFNHVKLGESLLLLWFALIEALL